MSQAFHRLLALVRTLLRLLRLNRSKASIPSVVAAIDCIVRGMLATLIPQPVGAPDLGEGACANVMENTERSKHGSVAGMTYPLRPSVTSLPVLSAMVGALFVTFLHSVASLENTSALSCVEFVLLRMHS